MQLWTPALNSVGDEVAEMEAIVDREWGNFKIEPWDYYYYAEKVRQDKYDFSEDATSPYFHVDSVRNGIFQLANKLYGVTATELPDAPKYQPDVKVYDLRDADG